MAHILTSWQPYHSLCGRDQNGHFPVSVGDQKKGTCWTTLHEGTLKLVRRVFKFSSISLYPDSRARHKGSLFFLRQRTKCVTPFFLRLFAQQTPSHHQVDHRCSYPFHRWLHLAPKNRFHHHVTPNLVISFINRYAFLNCTDAKGVIPLVYL
jgi:hypothetical protein